MNCLRSKNTPKQGNFWKFLKVTTKPKVLENLKRSGKKSWKVMEFEDVKRVRTLWNWGVPTKILGRATLMRFPKRRTCKIINSHDRWSWLASAKSESYILTFRLFTFWCCNFLSRSAQTNNFGFDYPENIFSSVSWVHYIQAMYSKEKCTIACVLLRRRNRTSLFLWH